MVTLRVTTGPSAGGKIEVSGQVVLGRQDADFTIEDAQVSRRHAVVRPVSGMVEVEDLGSANGTFVDGARLEAPTCVGNGARIRLGTTELVVEGVLALGPSGAGNVADPQVTRAREVPSRPVADPQVTRAREVPSTPVADPQVTRAREVPSTPVADPQVTQAREVPGEPRGAAAVPPSQRSPRGGPGGAAGLPDSVGLFQPSANRRTRGLASRSWLPVALSVATVIAAALVLVVYFATR